MLNDDVDDYITRVRQTPEEIWMIYRPQCCRNNNKYEDSSLKTLNDKKQHFSQMVKILMLALVSVWILVTMRELSHLVPYHA